MTVHQTARDLRTLVARRVGLARRVAMLSADPALKAALEANRCTVLEDPESHEALAAFAPQSVVAFDGLLSEGVRGLETLRGAIGDAELVLSFANAGAASALVRALTGESVAAAHSEAQVRTWLRQCGWVVASRDVVVSAPPKNGFSADTSAALRGLFEQLNPDAAADRFVFVARKGIEASPVEHVTGLTSLIITGAQDVGALEGTVRSVSGQLHQPLEVVLMAPLPQLELEALAAPLKGRAKFTVSVFGGEAGDALALTNRTLTRARGQYVCCLEAGELLERTHVSSLVKALTEGTVAWALSRAPKVAAGFSLRDWLAAGAVQRGRYVVDRQRLGAFAFTFAEGLPLAEAMVFCRLAAVFPPAVVGSEPTLDTQRAPASTPEALLDAMAARPLRRLVNVGYELQPAEPVVLGDVVEERLLEHSPRLAGLFRRARTVADSLKSAADQARRELHENRDESRRSATQDRPDDPTRGE